MTTRDKNVELCKKIAEGYEEHIAFTAIMITNDNIYLMINHECMIMRLFCMVPEELLWYMKVGAFGPGKFNNGGFRSDTIWSYDLQLSDPDLETKMRAAIKKVVIWKKWKVEIFIMLFKGIIWLFKWVFYEMWTTRKKDGK